MRLNFLLGLVYAGLSAGAPPSPQQPMHLGLDIESIAKSAVESFGDESDKLNIDQITETWKKVVDNKPGLAKKLKDTFFKEKTLTPPAQKPQSDSVWSFINKNNDKHPGYSLRGKKHDPAVLGIDTVKQYSGYIDNNDEGKHYFYWFFESRNDPANDPVLLWINGGPGCSSMLGLFFELGPSIMIDTGDLLYNPYAWNSNASVLFLDQPVDVGFSYTEGDHVTNSFDSAKDTFVFLDLFFSQFPEYSHLDFHILGESYAGIYIPTIASEVMSHGSDKSFNLTSILIGNGITDPVVQTAKYQPFLCGEGGFPQIIPDKRCDTMLKEQERCLELFDACYSSGSKFICVPANMYCDQRAFAAVTDNNINPYDVRMRCKGSECYPSQDKISEWLNLPEVQEILGAEVSKFEECSSDVMSRFTMSADQLNPYQIKVAELLDAYDLPVLIYAGDKDYVCNWLGNEAWTNELLYSNHEEFNKTKYSKFLSFNGEYIGDVKNYDKFTFLRLFDAGHMVPADQPENSLEMVNRWLSGDYSLSLK